MLKYLYKETGEIKKNLIRIEVAKKVLDLLPLFPHVEKNLRRQSLLRSSLFSARIEGNMLELSEVETYNSHSKNREKKEISNIASALDWTYSNTPRHITIDEILKLHALALSGISQDAGKFRNKPSAIFNQAGVAVHITSLPSQVPKLTDELILYINENKDHPVITASIAHFAFEKIHPFLDGNGRVGRLLTTLILHKAGYGFRGLATFEKYLSDHRESYYYFLSSEKKDITGFVEFFTESIATSAEQAIELLKNNKEEKAEDFLLPRRQEILAVIRDHKLVSFDFIRRRFMKVSSSALHNDVSVLLRKRLIKKLGDTRGVLYAFR